MAEPVRTPLEGRNLWKHYGAVTALRGADVALHAGEVVGLVGAVVADNLFLGREQLSRGGRPVGWLDRRAMRRRCEEELERLSVRVNSVSAPCRALSGGQRQAIAIARAIIWSRSVLLLDEPTAALGVAQQEQVAGLIRKAGQDGIAVMLISHNMQQVVDLCDRVIVLFQGRTVADLRRGEFGVEDLVSWITGAALRRLEGRG